MRRVTGLWGDVTSEPPDDAGKRNEATNAPTMIALLREFTTGGLRNVRGYESAEGEDREPAPEKTLLPHLG